MLRTESNEDPVRQLARRRDGSYAALTALFCVVLVLTNIVGVKLFEVFPDGRPAWMPGSGPLALTTGILTYPLTFLATDLTAEVWGRRKAEIMVWFGFGMSVLMLGIVHIAKELPPASIWSSETLGPKELQSAFEVTFQYPATLLFASMSAYLIAQLFDVRLYHFWWRVTKGRHMWIRNNGSTAISQLVDTIVVNSIFLPLAFDMPWSAVMEVIVAVYACKLLLAALDTPLIYLGRGMLRKFLKLESDRAPSGAPLA